MPNHQSNQWNPGCLTSGKDSCIMEKGKTGRGILFRTKGFGILRLANLEKDPGKQRGERFCKVLVVVISLVFPCLSVQSIPCSRMPGAAARGGQAGPLLSSHPGSLISNAPPRSHHLV